MTRSCSCVDSLIPDLLSSIHEVNSYWDKTNPSSDWLTDSQCLSCFCTSWQRTFGQRESIFLHGTSLQTLKKASLILNHDRKWRLLAACFYDWSWGGGTEDHKKREKENTGLVGNCGADWWERERMGKTRRPDVRGMFWLLQETVGGLVDGCMRWWWGVKTSWVIQPADH